MLCSHLAARHARPAFFSLLVILLGSIAMAVSNGASIYSARPNDPMAVYLTPATFAVKGDGVADDAPALQAAIDALQAKMRYGIVFVPEGRYRLGSTVNIWKGIRVIGYGENRPVFVLGANTPGFQTGDNVPLIHFVSDKGPADQPIREANPGTFFSALSNVNIEIQDGNPVAVGARAHFAQHCFIAHVDFQIGNGRAGVQQVGNEMDDCRFYGGDYGILTTKPSPSWPFLLIDSAFEGQRKAAISTEEGGMTLVRDTFTNVPTAVLVSPDRAEELFMTNCWLTDISGPALLISDDNNARPQYNLDNVYCNNVPTLAAFRGGEGQVGTAQGTAWPSILGPAPFYLVKNFTHGNQIDDISGTPVVKTTTDIEPLPTQPPPARSDVPDLPGMDTWANIKDLGAKGDGVTDDTAAIKEAIAGHDTLYFPSGRYLVSNTIALKPDTVLIGLNPTSTQIGISDGTPWFDGKGSPRALLETPQGGRNIVTGIGLDSGGTNGRVVACKWMAGANSLMNDVKFLGGHGTYLIDGTAVPPYNASRTGDGNPTRQWDSQYWSLWVTNGGGGTFKDIWTASSYAQAGVYVSDTSTPGRLYAISSEHHVRNEVQFRRVSNWKIYDMQMEEERAEGPHALPLEIAGCSNLTFANLYLYRVSMPNSFPYGVLLSDSTNIDFRGVHVYGPGKNSYDTTIYDQTHTVEIRSREIARITISGNPIPPQVPGALPANPNAVAEGAVEKVTGGFEFIDGITVDSQGNVYFIDARYSCIYRWSPADKQLTLVRDMPLGIITLGIDSADNLIGVGRAGRNPIVYAFGPYATDGELQVLTPTDTVPVAGQRIILPGHLWKDSHDILQVTSAPKPQSYLCPDGKTIIPVQNDLFRSWSLRSAKAGDTFFQADEFGQKVWTFTVNPDGALVNPKIFAEEGELSLAQDTEGNIYVSAGQIFVYDKTGKQIDVITTPERPATIAFGGTDKKTLFITARTGLYAVRTKYAGL
jgi:sugar lactone lactonase YvrE